MTDSDARPLDVGAARELLERIDLVMDADELSDENRALLRSLASSLAALGRDAERLDCLRDMATVTVTRDGDGAGWTWTRAIDPPLRKVLDVTLDYMHAASAPERPERSTEEP